MPAALSQLYRDHFDALRAYLARRLNCPEAGRDAAQDIFLRLLARPSAAPIDNPRGFLLKAARNFAIDLRRTAGTQSLEVPIDDHEETLVDAMSDPARIADARERLRALADGIAMLSPRCREVFCLQRLDGLTQNEIAARLGISAKAVEKHLAQAKCRLASKAAVQSGRKRRTSAAAALACVAALSVWLGLVRPDDSLVTEPGERRHLRLADGSQLDVAPSTRLRIKFDSTHRRIELDEGRIAIAVAADAQRPFEVAADGGVIRDIGTRFEVSAGRDRARVTVAEGIVEIDVPGAGMRRVKAGEAAEFDSDKIWATQPVQAAAALAWTAGQLTFDAAPLAEVIATLNRYRRTPVAIDDPQLMRIRVSGVFLIDDETAPLRAIEQVAPVRFVPANGKVLARAAEDAKP